jgi:hypothetical protein
MEDHNAKVVKYQSATAPAARRALDHSTKPSEQQDERGAVLVGQSRWRSNAPCPQLQWLGCGQIATACSRRTMNRATRAERNVLTPTTALYLHATTVEQTGRSTPGSGQWNFHSSDHDLSVYHETELIWRIVKKNSVLTALVCCRCCSLL